MKALGTHMLADIARPCRVPESSVQVIASATAVRPQQVLFQHTLTQLHAVQGESKVIINACSYGRTPVPSSTPQLATAGRAATGINSADSSLGCISDAPAQHRVRQQ